MYQLSSQAVLAVRDTVPRRRSPIVVVMVGSKLRSRWELQSDVVGGEPAYLWRQVGAAFVVTVVACPPCGWDSLQRGWPVMTVLVQCLGRALVKDGCGSTVEPSLAEASLPQHLGRRPATVGCSPATWGIRSSGVPQEGSARPTLGNAFLGGGVHLDTEAAGGKRQYYCIKRSRTHLAWGSQPQLAGLQLISARPDAAPRRRREWYGVKPKQKKTSSQRAPQRQTPSPRVGLSHRTPNLSKVPAEFRGDVNDDAVRQGSHQVRALLHLPRARSCPLDVCLGAQGQPDSAYPSR